MSSNTHPQFQSQYNELARLKTIKQTCLILGLIFSIIGLISMCDNPVEVNNRDGVAQKIEQPQKDKSVPQKASFY